MFFVNAPGLLPVHMLLTKITMLFFDWTLDNATYNWPCVNTGLRKSNPIYGMVCPWALFIDMTKAKRIGNWRRINWKGKSVSDGASRIRGM